MSKNNDGIDFLRAVLEAKARDTDSFSLEFGGHSIELSYRPLSWLAKSDCVSEATKYMPIRHPDGTETIDSVPVTIGLRDNRYTQITGGLVAGDVVQIGNALPVQTFGPAGGDEGDGPAFIPPAPGD